MRCSDCKRRISLLTLLLFSAFIITLYALSVGTVSSSFVQLVNEGESEFVWMYSFETSKNGDSPATAGNSCLTDGTILSSTTEFLGDQTGAFSDTEWAIFSPKPILTINKEDNPPDNVQCGAVLTYTITYSNVGNADATGVIITDIFDSNVTFESSWPISPTGGAGNLRSWEIGTLEKKGGHGNITVTVIVSTSAISGTVLINLVQIDSPNAEMASSTETTTVVCPVPILTINKDDDPPDNVQCGAVLTYTITYSNVGDADATGVIITDTFDNNVTFEGSWPVSPTGGAGNVRYWEIGDLHIEGPGNITAMVIVSTSAVSGTVLTNLVQIDSPDADMASSTETTTVVCSMPILTINKEDNTPDKVQPGAVLTYTITYSNVGDADATGVIITDTFDNNVTFERSWPSPTGGTGNVRCWEIGDLHIEDPGDITATVIVSTSAVSGVLTNFVQIDSADAEVASSTETTTVVAGNRRLYLPIVAKCWDIPPCEDLHEPNNAMCSAHAISTSNCIASYICCPLDLKDYYYIEIATLNTINIDLTSLPADYDLYLYDSPTASMPVTRSERYGQASEHITYSPTHTGRYYIRVHPYTDGVCSNTDSYQLCVSFH